MATAFHEYQTTFRQSRRAPCNLDCDWHPIFQRLIDACPSVNQIYTKCCVNEINILRLMNPIHRLLQVVQLVLPAPIQLLSLSFPPAHEADLVSQTLQSPADS